MATWEPPPLLRRVMRRFATWANIAIFSVLIAIIAILVAPTASGNPILSAGIILWVSLAILLLWLIWRVVFGNRHNLYAFLGLRPPQAPPDYVRDLFDEYADTFDEHLLVDLAYAAPNLLRSAVGHRLDSRENAVVVDLGCGTGICGPLFRPIAGELIGVDLSPKMLERADARGIYDELHDADLVRYMENFDQKVDLCLAADVFVYIGDLGPVFRAIAAALGERGYLAFTVEGTSEPGWVLRRTGRYAHSRAYIRDLAERNRLKVEAVESAVLRKNRGKPIMGDVWLLSPRRETPVLQILRR
jgi:predicted TPR repeat methyltransferase